MHEREYGRFDAVCLLQPTSPLRAAGEIDACIALFESTGADTVFSMLPVPSRYNPHWVYERNAEGALRISTGEAVPITRRQALPAAYHRDGAIYVVKRDVIMERNSLYGDHVFGFEREESASVDIDTPEDWARAEVVMATAMRKRVSITDIVGQVRESMLEPR